MRLNEFIQIGSNIKKIRKEKGISQKQMAEEILKIPRSTYSNYENNNRVPDKITLEKIAKALEVDVTAFLSHEDYERLTFETDFDFSELDPEILKIFNELKNGLSKSNPQVEFTNSLLIQNIVIGYLAKLKVELEIYGICHFEGFKIYDNILLTGKDLLNTMYAEYKSEKEALMRIESIESIWRAYNSASDPEASKNLHLLISDHISYHGKKDVPITFLNLVGEGGQESGS